MQIRARIIGGQISTIWLPLDQEAPNRHGVRPRRWHARIRSEHFEGGTVDLGTEIIVDVRDEEEVSRVAPPGRGLEHRDPSGDPDRDPADGLADAEAG